MDPRKDYIIKCTSNLLSDNDVGKSLAKDTMLDNFLNSVEFQAIRITKQKTGVVTVQEVSEICEEDARVVFISRTSYEALTSENISRLLLITNVPTANPMHSLYHQLKNIYGPSFEGKWGNKMDSNARRLLYDLRAGLDSAIYGFEREGFKKVDENDVRSISTPGDEFDFWIKVAASGNVTESVKKKAEYFNEQFSKISTSWRTIAKPDISGVKDIIDQTLFCMDNIWNCSEHGGAPYSETRMRKFVEVVSSSLITRTQSEFTTETLWDLNSSSVKPKLAECAKFLKYWTEKVDEYTSVIWMDSSSPNRWKGKKIEFDQLNLFYTRIQEVIDLKSQFNEVSKLLAGNSQLNLDIKQAFSPFTSFYCLHVNAYTDPLFISAKTQFSKNMEGIEAQLTNLLRKDVFEGLNATKAGYQALREMQKWQGLLTRKNIMKHLQNERDSVLDGLYNGVDKIKQEFESRSGQSLDPILGMEAIPSAHSFSKYMNSIIWIRQLSSKIKRIQSSSAQLLGDLKKYENFKNKCEDIFKDMSDFEKEQFESWKTEITGLLKNSEQAAALQLTGRMMDLDMKDGLLKVNYSERLVVLLREVRQLNELGFRKKIPKQILDIAETGKKYYKEALTLKQVANFYNSMSTQIIEWQKPMIVQQAINFEQTVKNVKGNSKFVNDYTTVTWENAGDLEQYIIKVQDAANNIMNENRRLRKLHANLTDLVNELFEVDLLKQRNIWKDKLDLIRKTIEIGTNGRDPKLCRPWRIHWDFQLYKALEYQYQLGLMNINQNLGEVKADVVLQGKNIMFKPSLEELKQKYYREVKAFVSLPAKSFVGVAGNADIYKTMPERNASLLSVVYSKAEELFAKLIGVLAVFKPWAAVGYLDIDNLDEKIHSLEEWDYNIKVIRQKRKELEKLQDLYKVDCITINASPFKNSADDMLQRLLENLTGSLKNSLKTDCEKLEEFVTQALEKLSQKPKSMEEISKVKEEYFEFKVKQKEMLQKMNEAEEKNKLLRLIAGQTFNISAIQKRWENFEVAIGDFDQVLKEQHEQMKKELGKRSTTINSETEKFYQRWTALKPKKLDEIDQEQAKEYSAKMKEWKTTWNEIEQNIDKLKKDHEHFDMAPPNIAFMAEIKKEMLEEEEGWKVYEEFEQELEGFEKEDWLSYRNKLYTFQDFTFKWADRIKQQKKKDALSLYLSRQIDNYKQLWPVLKLLVGEAFEKEHWRNLFTILKLPKDVTIENVKFSHFLQSEKILLEKFQDMKELAARAQGEVSLREAVQELRVWCETTEFELTDYTANGRTTPLIKEWRDLMTKVSDNQSLLASLKESKFFSRFADQVEQFEVKLGGIDDYLAKLNIIQRKWVYLEPIFTRGALPQEQGRFKRLDDEYRSIMLGIQRDPKVVSIVDIPGIKDTLEMILDQIERCQKALNDFLEEKRSKFPRFYFLGDDDLLEILGQSKNPQVIQMHLKKLFAGIHRVALTEDNTTIIAMVSTASEKVVLNTPVSVNDEEVEVWLNSLTKFMQSTLQQFLIACLKEKSMELAKYPSQILCLSEMVKFNEFALASLPSGKLVGYKQELTNRLSQLTGAPAGGNILLQLKLKALILDLIHHIEVVDILIANNVNNPNDWLWYKQLKFLMSSKSLCEILMCNGRFDYTYEYQGNAPKLVHTPLTDKCYLTLTQGMAMGYGGNPYGPAGTGKTESVKALGQAFGRQVLVFNCDEGIDFKSMGRIFIGLVKCGAWGCFDEFNRLLEEQLSAISQQIQVIQWAIKEKEATVELLGKTVEVNKNAGIFVTMNPAGKAYGGRSKLPDNLKQLFRPVAMSVPDNELIAETLLFSEGFKTAKVLAQKIVAIFILSRQLLSPQQHYDWGLRALKTILTVAGQLIQEERGKVKDISPTEEAVLLIKAIRINTLSKLTYGDMKKFISLINDVFPNIESTDIVYEALTKSIKEVLTEMKLDAIQQQIAKVLQFYEATKQRMGVVLVGPSGCGKTTIWKVLKKAHEKMGQAVKIFVMNPKSMPRSQLLGHMNNDTREFTEGVLTSSAREVVKQSQEVLSWIICDGDIDPEWIESLNSVLDDNHLLTLPTGERISFGSNVNFIFETSDLSYASPATVSRMGMIFLNNEDISLKSLVGKWVKRQKEVLQSKLETWIDQYFFKILEWVIQYEDSQIVQTTRVGTVMNVLSQMTECSTQLEFQLGLLRGFASNFSNEIRGPLSRYVFDMFGERPPVDLAKSPLDFYLPKDTSNLRALAVLTTDLSLNDFNDINEPPVVNTISIQRDLEILKPWVINSEPFIVVGPEGSGKSLLIRTAFNELRKKMKIQVATIHCNAQTMAQQVIQKLNQICLKGTSAQGRIFKPKECSRLILYLKDINLPKPDKYQTIQLIAFLQQIITHRGFYDDNLEFVYLDEKIQVVASMNPSSTIGRHTLASRFTANIRLLYIDYPTQEELSAVYTSFLTGILQNEQKFTKTVSQNGVAIAKRVSTMLVEYYSQIQKKFSIDENRHYLITPRSLTHIIFGLLRYESLNTPELLFEALYNESSRSFRDRLTSLESHSKFENFLVSLMKTNFKFQPENNIYFSSVSSTAQIRTLTRLSKEDYIHVVEQGLLLYEREFKEIKLILLDEILNLMSSLDRALSRSSSVLLAGRSGIGRKICTSLVALMLRMEFLSPSLGKEYASREFKKDLKHFLEIAGVQNKPCVLFFEDHQLVKPEFLEIINSLISSGEVPGLYSQEEVDHLFGPQAEDVRRENYGKSLYESFCIRVQNNMRVVLSLDHTHRLFASNCASNPALFTKCHIIWIDSWNRESMSTIVTNELQEIFNNLTPKEREELNSCFINFHKSGIARGAAPRHFFSLCETYKKIYEGKISARGNQSSHLLSGLKKLAEAQDLVDNHTQRAQEQKVLLAKKQGEADEALKNITKAMAEAADRKKENEVLKERLQEEEEKIKLAKTKIEKELSVIQPLVEEARGAVGSINKSHLDELRSLMMPPEAIHDVMNGVLRMFGNFDGSWNNVKKFLKNRSVIENILDFDPKMITPDIRKDMEKFLQEKSNSFEKSVIYRSSLAAGPLADWVKAILKYSVVLEKINPLEDDLNKVKKKLDSQKGRVVECEDQLKELAARVEKLKDEFSKKTSEAEILKNDLRRAEENLGIAQSLLDKLGDEKSRWQGQVNSIEKQVKSLPYDCLLSAAFTTYLSDADENDRETNIKEWKAIMKNTQYDFLKFMSTESITLLWKSQGLPGDSLSLENSTMVFNTSKVPLLIDPNTQATEWLKKNLGLITTQPLEILNQQDPKFTNQLELAIRFGKTLLIQELDQIEPFLFPILRRELVHQGPRWVVLLGDKAVDYNPNFQLYLCTRNSFIDIQPDSAGLLQIINYTVTKSGLEGKLLSLIINHEQPELEKKKTDLLNKEENLKIQLADLEKKLLTELATSQGNILENKALIENLNETKEKSSTIAKSLKESSELQESLDKQREVYRPLANKGASIFILINDLQKGNNMYRFSLATFLKIFTKSLDIQMEFENTLQKLEYAGNNLNKNVFNMIGLSLFKSDRLMFGLHLVRGIRPELFAKNEWEFFLGNTAAVETNAELPRWASFDRKDLFCNWYGTFTKIVGNLQLNEKDWEVWNNHIECEKNFPANNRMKVSHFQKVIMVQVFRPDRLESAMTNFVCESIGLSSVTGMSITFQVLLKEESNPETPILFITSPGSDPSKELEEFAEKEVGRGNFQQLSMGGNQNEVALQMLREAAKKGYWVCFKNLHLVTAWLPLLEKELKASTQHKDFRLWLTTEPHPKFPAILLETCQKVTYEAPPGVKKNLQRIYQSWGNTFIEQGTPLRSQTLFVLAWFHALIQERRTYIPQGWSKFYEFSYGDLKAGATIIENILKANEASINWETLYGLFENAIYGGRVDNEFDMRILRAYLELYFSQDVLFNNKKLTIGVSIPTTKVYKEYNAFINKMPDIDNPNIFNLPMNIDKAVQRYNTTQVINMLKVLMRVNAEEMKFDREKWSFSLQPLINMWKTLHKQLRDGGFPTIKPQQLNSDDPIASFVYAETFSALQMVEKIEESIEGINKVLFGSGLLTSDIQNEATILMSGGVPSKWTTIWEGPDNANSWLKGFCRRANCLKRWVQKVEKDQLIKEELNLAELFRPEVFLNALRQRTARSSQTAIDAMKLISSFEADKLRSPNIVRIKGLLLQGCGFDGVRLIDPPANLSEFIALPVMQLAWVGEKDSEPYPPTQLGVFPVFFSGNREKLLTKIKLFNQGPVNDRITAGVAVFLTEND